MLFKVFVVEQGQFKGVIFEKVSVEYDENGCCKLIFIGEFDEFVEVDDVIIVIGQDNVFFWIECDLGIEFGKWDFFVLDCIIFQFILFYVFFGGDVVFGLENIIIVVVYGYQVVVFIYFYLEGKDLFKDCFVFIINLVCQKMGIYEWMYDSLVVEDLCYVVLYEEKIIMFINCKIEVEFGFSIFIGFKEV